MAKNRLDLDLIVAVHPRSGGQGGFGRVGAAACHRSGAPAAAGSPE